MMSPANKPKRATLWLTLFLIIAIATSSSLGPSVYAAEGDEDVNHPRRAMTERAFHRLKDTLSPDFPSVRDSTLHFVDLDIANAWVNQRAEVYVATGLLDLLQTEEQIAGVLAHELAHVTERHVPKQIQRHWSLALLVLAASVASDRAHVEQRNRIGVVHPLLMYAYSREAELEADQVGMKHMERAGYDPKGLLEALELLQTLSSRQPVEELWMTHPLPELRLGALRRYIDPRMGIPIQRAPGQEREGPRTQYDDPAEAAAAFVHASWADPSQLDQRSRSEIPEALRADASPGLYPREWPPGFAVHFDGVAVEREEQTLLDYSTDVRLELDTPLGTARFPLLRLAIQPAAKGWQVSEVQLVEGDPIAGIETEARNPGPSAGQNPSQIGAAAPFADRLLRAVAFGVSHGDSGDPRALLETAIAAAVDSRPRVILGQMIDAGASLRDAGFSLAPLPLKATSLSAASYEQLAAPSFKPSTSTDYVDLRVGWRITAPSGQQFTIERRLWLAIEGEHVMGLEPVPLHL